MGFELFTLRINLGSDVMDSPEDVAGALERVAERLREVVVHMSSIRDDNGNTVGEFWFS